MNPISLAIFVILAGASAAAFFFGLPIYESGGLLVAALFAVYAVQMARQWEQAVVLRAGKLSGVKGPGLFMIIPVLDSVAVWVDRRIQTTEVIAEKALTKDTVPVNVDAIIFWVVQDTEKAALEIADYKMAIQRVAQILFVRWLQIPMPKGWLGL